MNIKIVVEKEKSCFSSHFLYLYFATEARWMPEVREEGCDASFRENI